MRKAFKPLHPSLKLPGGQNSSSADGAEQQTSSSTPGPDSNKRRKFAAPTLRQPLAEKELKAANNVVDKQYFRVLYTKRAPQKKRVNKSFADGILEIENGVNLVLYSEDGKVAGKGKVKRCSDVPDGSQFEVGSFEVEVDSALSKEQYMSGQCFVKDCGAKAPPASLPASSGAASLPAPKFKLPSVGAKAANGPPKAAKPSWLHDPASGLVLNEVEWAAQKGGSVSPVVLDPFLGRQLRDHQKEGVKFMYECVMGLREGWSGCILADDMGLGKTLQVLSLIWTLIRQGPAGKPVARRVLVVTPSTLTNNWAAEVSKWLGSERLRVLVLTAGADGAQQVTDFVHGALWKVLIGSYESLRKHAAALAGCIDLLVCDEGHRLKASAGNKTIDALLSLRCKRRILLTGTPLQNNLEEYYAMVNFCNPDLLGSLSSFKRIFGDPIQQGKERTATPEQRDLGTDFPSVKGGTN